MSKTIRKEFDKLSKLVTSEQTVLLLVNVFGAEAVKDFLLEEAENEIDKIWDEIKDIKAVMRNHHIGHPSNGGSMGGDMCRAYGTNGEERGRK